MRFSLVVVGAAVCAAGSAFAYNSDASDYALREEVLSVLRRMDQWKRDDAYALLDILRRAEDGQALEARIWPFKKKVISGPGSSGITTTRTGKYTNYPSVEAALQSLRREQQVWMDDLE